MAKRAWEDLLTDRDEQVLCESGYESDGASNWDTRGYGSSPALLVIDMQELIVGDDEPIIKAVQKSQIAMGDVAWTAIRDHLQPFLESVREVGIPIYHTRVVPKQYQDPRHEDLRIVKPMQPTADETVLKKPYPSAFYGTDLLTNLNRSRIDTLILIGNTTSGCIRATAVDAQQYGYNLVVPEECVFDRIEASHRIGLLDLWMKYAEVQPRTEVERELCDRYGSSDPPDPRGAVDVAERRGDDVLEGNE